MVPRGPTSTEVLWLAMASDDRGGFFSGMGGPRILGRELHSHVLVSWDFSRQSVLSNEAFVCAPFFFDFYAAQRAAILAARNPGTQCSASCLCTDPIVIRTRWVGKGHQVEETRASVRKSKGRVSSMFADRTWGMFPGWQFTPTSQPVTECDRDRGWGFLLS